MFYEIATSDYIGIFIFLLLLICALIGAIIDLYT